MKNIKLLIISLILAGLTSCSDLSKLNENPARSTSIPPELLIPNIQFSHSYGYNNWVRFLTFPGGFTNHWTGPWGIVEYGGKGKKNLVFSERLWTILSYYEIIKNVVALEEFTKYDESKANLYAMSKILRVEAFLKLTDYYGDIPYFEGGQGYFKNILNPKYDTQEEIYADFFLLLDEALELFDDEKITAPKELYFGGDLGKWRRFANSMKLRLAMRLIKVEPALAQQRAREAFHGEVMQSNADVAYVKHQYDMEDTGPGNALSNAMLNSKHAPNYGVTTIRMTTELFKALSEPDTDSIAGNYTFRRLAAKDARLLMVGSSYTLTTDLEEAVDITEMVRAWNAKAPNQQGPADLTTTVDPYINIGGYLTVPAQEFVYGGSIQREYGINLNRDVWANPITRTQVPELPQASVAHHVQRLTPSKYILSPDSPFIHMSYAETQFLLAETTLRGWNIDDLSAADRFRRGYIAAVEQWGLFGAPVPDRSQIEDYMETYLIPRIEQGGQTAMEEVMTQQWILHMLDPFEAWSLIRRTNGMPTDYARFYNRNPTENETGGERPRRMQYPLEEQTKNKASYDEAVTRMDGGDDWMTPVWWDKN